MVIVKPDPASTAKLRTLGQISPLPAYQIAIEGAVSQFTHGGLLSWPSPSSVSCFSADGSILAKFRRRELKDVHGGPFKIHMTYWAAATAAMANAREKPVV
jgi:hypothetical protein